MSRIGGETAKVYYVRTMAIAPICDKCGKELVVFGAILFSPPDEQSTVKKFHICEPCYDEMEKELKKDSDS